MSKNIYPYADSIQRFIDLQNRIVNLLQGNQLAEKWLSSVRLVQQMTYSPLENAISNMNYYESFVAQHQRLVQQMTYSPLENAISNMNYYESFVAQHQRLVQQMTYSPIENAINTMTYYQSIATQSQLMLPVTKLDTPPVYLLDRITETLMRPYQTLWDSAFCALEMAKPYLPEEALAECHEIVTTKAKQASRKFLSYENIFSILTLLLTIFFQIQSNKSQSKSDEILSQIATQNAIQIEQQEKIISQNEVTNERLGQIVELLQEQDDEELQETLKYLVDSIDFLNNEIATLDLQNAEKRTSCNDMPDQEIGDPQDSVD